jgi:hypothetical protein
VTVPGSSPLSAEHEQAVADARTRSAKIRVAARVATFNGWTLAVLAGFSLLFALGSAVALVMAVGLGWIAWNEFRGRARLLAFDPGGAVLLGRNQLALLALIAAYALFSIVRTLTVPIPELAELEEVVGPVGSLASTITVAVYAAVLVGTVLAQGLNARYYFARRRMIEAFLAETPEWVVALLRRLE